VIGTGIGKKIVIVLATFAVVGAGVYLSFTAKDLWKRVAPPVQKVPEETKSVTLFFGNRDADRLLSETREVPVEQGFEGQVKAVLAELIKGAQDSEKMNAIPPGSALLSAFWVEDAATLYLDFNRAFVANHPGGSAGEYYTIAAILKTVSTNFPQVARVQLLVEGAPVESIAGHFAAGKPLNVLEWR
jgi:spore germination protein GerM